MHIIGLDLGKRNTQLCVGTEDGAVALQQRVPTTKEGLTRALAPYVPAQILLEASTSAEWVARHLEQAGHEVIVGDPRFGPMYAQADKKIKTDKRDAAALFHARRLGAFKPATRRSDTTRALRQSLLVRSSVVRMRAKIVVQIRAMLEAEGLKLKSCAIEHFTHALEEVSVPDELGSLLLPLVTLVDTLTTEIEGLDTRLDDAARGDPVAARFDEVVGVGSVTALAFIACIGEPGRFSSAREVAAYLGLVPREYSSGESRRQGHITKAGDTLTRSYLIQAAWRILRSKSADVAPLREWALRVAERRGKQRAITGLARRLARILFAIWRDDVAFDVARLMRI